MNAPAPTRLDALTGIRIFAAVAVFFSHLPLVPGAPTFVQSFMSSGYNGVTFFFMLSGFILCWNYDGRLTSGNGPRAVWSYAVARWARIMPLYVFALLLLVVFTTESGAQLRGLLADPAWWLSLAALQTWSPDADVAFSYNGPGWSIGVEVFLYALFPLLILAIARIRDNARAIVALLAVALIVVVGLAVVFVATGQAELPWSDPASDHRWLYRTPLTRVPDFVIGICLAYICRMGERRQLGAALQVSGAVLMVGFMAIPALLYSAFSWDALYVVPAAFVILGLSISPQTWFARFLSTKTLVLLGEASFAFYLLHTIILSFTPRATGDGLLAWGGNSLVLFVIILCVSVGAHLLVERPSRVFVRRLLDR